MNREPTPPGVSVPVSDATKVALPPPLAGVFDGYMRERFPQATPKRVAGDVQRLSDAFTSERSALPGSYLNHPPSRSAYLAFFHPQQVLRGISAMTEVRRRAAVRGMWPSREPLRVLDLGAGLAAMSQALLASGPLPESLEFTLVDHQKSALSDGRELLVRAAAALRPGAKPPLARGAAATIYEWLGRAHAAGWRYDIALLGGVLNEISEPGRVGGALTAQRNRRSAPARAHGGAPGPAARTGGGRPHGAGDAGEDDEDDVPDEFEDEDLEGDLLDGDQDESGSGIAGDDEFDDERGDGDGDGDVPGAAAAAASRHGPWTETVERVLGLLDPGGLLVAIEPAIPPVARALMQAREDLRETTTTVAPCTHDAACPLLALRKDWCFTTRPAVLPPFVREMARRLGHQTEEVRYAFWAAAPGALAAPPEHDPSRHARVVSDAMPGGQVVCCEGRRERRDESASPLRRGTLLRR